MDAARPIDVLLVDGQISPPGPIGVIGQLTVLVQQQRQPVGSSPELRGLQPGSNARQIGLGQLTGLAIDTAGQSIEELLDDPHMLGPDRTTRLGRSHIRQCRGQRFTTQRGPRPQQPGLRYATLRFALRDPQRFRKHLGPGVRAQLGRRALRGELMNQSVIDGRLTAIPDLQPLLNPKYLGSRQRREGQLGHLGLDLFPARNSRENLIAIRNRTRRHISNTSSIPRPQLAGQPNLWMNSPLGITCSVSQRVAERP